MYLFTDTFKAKGKGYFKAHLFITSYSPLQSSPAVPYTVPTDTKILGLAEDETQRECRCHSLHHVIDWVKRLAARPKQYTTEGGHMTTQLRNTGHFIFKFKKAQHCEKHIPKLLNGSLQNIDLFDFAELYLTKNHQDCINYYYNNY